jgi:4-amino-4-deoxy-L-arabinose transferase-like glycosyltransferase
MLIVLAVAVAKLLAHCYFNNRYGYFRDEFDYLTCGNHLAWGYVDQPPLIPFLARISRAVLGDSLRSIRFLPAVASSVLVVQTAVLARELSGRRFALLLSAVTILVAPQYLSNGSLLGTNCLEPNLWMGCAYFALLAVKRDEPRYWLGFGAIAGLGMEEKYSIAVFGFGIVVGLLLTGQRRVFANKWIWLGGLAALLVFLPHFAVEYPLPLALCRIDAQHQSRGARRHSPSAAVFPSADASCSSLDRSHLDYWPAGVVNHGAPETLPLSRLELSGRVRSFLCVTREELLPGAGLSHAAGSGRGRD